MTPSKNCENLIKASENFKSLPYSDLHGVPTIGYGSTYYEDGTRVVLSDPSITEERAVALMRVTLDAFADQVEDMVHVPLTQNQFDALCDFAYNEGPQHLQTSTLLRLLNAHDYAGAAEQFDRWVYSGGEVVQGLVTRRKAEKALFLREV